MRVVVDETPSDGRGGSPGEAPRQRALTLVDLLYRAQVLDFDELAAATEMRRLYFAVMAPSEGVSSYGLSPGGSNPARKGDRKAERLTGISIAPDGEIKRGASRANRSAHWSYTNALVALAGCHDEEGNKIVDPQVSRLMIRAIIDSEHMPTQTEIGQARTNYKSGKQISAIGATFVKEHLRRLALHFRMVKGETVK